MKIVNSVAFCLSLLVPIGAHASESLTVVDWGGIFQEGLKQVLYDPYTRQTGNQIVLDTWQGGIGTLRAKLASGVSNWDVIEVEAEEEALGCQDGLFKPINWEVVGYKSDYIPGAATECGVGTILWSVGLAWNKDKTVEAPKSWKDFFDLKKYPGKRSLRRGPKYALEIALLGDGVAPADLYKVLNTPEGVDRAFAKLDTIKDNLIFWEGGSQPIQTLTSGDTVLSAIYSSDFLKSQQDGVNVGMLWDESFYQTDYWVVAANAPEKETNEFLALWSKPETQASFVKIRDYGPANSKAVPLIDKTRLKDLPIAPENIAHAIQTDSGFWVAHIEELNARFEQWSSK
ncbi:MULTISPECIES: extracellular solute-binding protein [unclassified Rhizobium]|uniref:extracellular solute-binding protein n=1 Tax=unclassified Rhizobium TaxID=2613769 RepID=UPI0016213BC1|nr:MULTISPECIES: extracellular solute-binding protein [unclassified Rhizobium]MBB3386227.1 putative spermidine/putrescine transport system substrate-binding protein [Rhizobium sp. BK098]MBB3571914.1 putative spermidine/putrescine transport system substrate-binding protein [Rhizobium sp. BK491]MBB3617931.1 putative spermidine/putrescine transport system substrate-binding protein [Rhizobium sp. BK609]MBB3683616.1 putative spermidine/putrescine transport system substrate-binding protein [Rhizobium